MFPLELGFYTNII